VSTAGVTFQLRSGTQAAEHIDELRALHHEVYGQAEDETLVARQFQVWRRQPGSALAEARHGGYLVGYASGMPLRSSTSWWKDATTSLPAETTTEYPGRTFALTELLVRPAWRRQGIARALHDLIIGSRCEERATLTVSPEATSAQIAFRNWGWHKAARIRGPGPGSPVLDVLLIPLPAGHE
jgi:ribosomal protein S18 acetylase RimI-like enzyme